MKKIKKLLAMIMAMTMVLGMAMTVSAAPSTEASIEINGLTANDGTVIKVYPVVLWDSEENVWDIQSWVTEGNVTLSGEGAPSANWAGLKTDATKEGSTAVPVPDSNILIEGQKATISGLNIGMYLVLASGNTTDYEVMGVLTYTYDNDNNLIGPLDQKVYAKGEKYPINKEFTTEDKTVIAGYGEEISYTINATFPSFGENQTDRTFWIEDQPSGLSIQNIVVEVNGETLGLNDDYTLSPSVPAQKDQKVRIEFTSTYIGKTNEHATEPVEITVTAKVESTDSYSNKAVSNKGKDSETVERKTGSMILTKKNEDLSEILTGAEFEIYNGDQILAFCSTGNPANPSEYRPFIEGVDDPDARVTTLVVGDENAGANRGKITIVGLGDGVYTIKETKAPNGYAVRDEFTKTIVYKENPTGNEDNDAINIVFNVQNSKLASLPSTGGIGTTIFTIGGCAIMIAAAALYFVNRRKSEEN